MASLTKTYKGDLTTSIAGVIYDRIKQIDDKRRLDKTGASEEVKQEAVKLKKEDSNAIQVQNRPLGEVVARFFTPLQGKFLKTNSKVDNLSVKANLIAGGIADTQKLLINRNQLLEDKFDQMLSIVGTKSAINKQKEAESNFEAMEKELEKGLDLSGTFAYEKTRTGTYGVLGKLLSFILGNGFTRRITAQIIKRLVPKGIRARARLLRKSLLPVRKFANKLAKPGRGVVTRLLQPFSIFAGKKGLGFAGKRVARGAIGEFFLGPLLRRFLQKGVIGFFSGPVGRFFDRRSLAKTLKALRRELDIGDLRKLRGVGLARFLESKATNILTMDQMGLRPGMKKITKKLSSSAAKRAGTIGARKAPKQLVSTMTEGVLARAFKSPAVRRLLLKKLGPEAMERIGVKAAAGGVKGGFPIVGTGYAVIEGLVRLIMGDPKGMMLSFGSGIPTAGWAFAIIDILRDIDRKAYDMHIEPNLPLPSDVNIAAFFQQALGISPDQYERGNIGKAPIKGMGSDISSISSLVGVTKAFGDATGFGAEVGSLVAAAGLGNIKETTGFSFDISKPNLSRRSRDKKNSGIDPRILEMYPELDPNKPGDYIKLKRKTLPLDTAMNEEEPDPTVMERFTMIESFRQITGGEADDGVFSLPFGIEIPNIFNRGEGGNDVTSTSSVMGGDASTIEFYGQQGRDRSGEPGVDFSFKDYKNNYNLFPGYVLETGLLYGKGYGNVVVIRSTDPSNGKQFDSLYSHFPDGGIAVKVGQQVAAGDLLGSVGFVSVDTPGVPQLQPNNAGNMSGWHTSVDFFEPDSPARYSNADKLINLVTSSGGSTPHGLLQKLKPVTNQSSLNNVGSNNKLATTMTNMVENGSSERLMTKRKASKRPPIVIINNQIVNTSQTQIAMGNNNKESGNFFEAYNLARYTV